MIHCLFLVYNPIDLARSLKRLSQFLNMLDSNYSIVVIDNGHKLKINQLQNIKIIGGDNRYWEFSGWAVGKAYLEDNDLISQEDSFCIVNDTFDKNHYFSRLTSYLYVRRWKRLKKSTEGIVLGELHNRDKQFFINNIELSSWISSYFFLIDYKTFTNISFVDTKICKAVLDVDNESVKFDDAIVDEELSNHINGWLRPTSSGWYLARKSSNDIIEKKAIAILHEKFLSANFRANGTVISNVYAGVLGRLVNKFDRVIYNLLN